MIVFIDMDSYRLGSTIDHRHRRPIAATTLSSGAL
jgi:hypothetical protein